MSQTNAWLLDVGGKIRAAVGRREVFHLIDAAETFDVPLTPAYCRQVVLWQDRLLPVLDMAVRVGGAASASPFLAVVGYQRQRGEAPQFGALRLQAPPRQLQVTDEQACDLPPDLEAWRPWSLSCFEQQGQVVPVLDLWRLFSSAPSEVLIQEENVDTGVDAR